MRLLHDSHLAAFRTPFGAVAVQTPVTLRLAVWGDEEPRRVSLRLWDNRETLLPMHCEKTSPGSRLYRTDFTTSADPAVLWYFFVVEFAEAVLYYGDQTDGCGGVGQETYEQPTSYQLTVYHPWSVPEWLCGALVYQIFPDRFYNPYEKPLTLPPGALLHNDWYQPPLYARAGDTGEILGYDFFGGNLPGIQAKLAYLADLGVKAIYCNPIFSAVSNHKYDTGDYETVDPGFGGDEALRALCEAAEIVGIRVLLDGVFSHTGSDSRYFNKEGRYKELGAYQSEKSPYYPWYRFDEWPDRYDAWWNIGNLPNVNELEPSYEKYIISGENSIVAIWQRLGAKGWRLDVADELPTAFIQKFRERLKKMDSDSALIGEVWEDASRKVSYGELRNYFNGFELDSVMNYPFREAVLGFVTGTLDGATAMRRLFGLYEHYPRFVFHALLNLLGTHDVARLLTVLGGASSSELTEQQQRCYRLTPAQKETAYARLRLAVFWQMTFPGSPMIYYADEAGLEGFTDPYNRGTFPWGREDETVQSWYWRMTGLRQRYPALIQGEWRLLLGGKDAVAYARVSNGETAVAAFNRSAEEPGKIHIAGDADLTGDMADVFTGERVVLTPGTELTVPAGQCRLWVKTLRWPDRKRAAGVLLHPTALPSAFGSGDIGWSSWCFLDFLAAAGQSIWQFLPLGPTNWDGSPYSGTSAFAISPLLISPESLWKSGWLDKAALEAGMTTASDQGRVRLTETARRKKRLLHQAWHGFRQRQPADYARFCQEQAWWLDDYALYAVARERFGGMAWWSWPEELRVRDAKALEHCRLDWAEELNYQRFLQYVAQHQWETVRIKARGLGITLVGDIPLYVSGDSADVWAHPEWFEVDAAGRATRMGGVPPDYFSADGQLWGNPLYRWDVMAQDNYHWWAQRLERTLVFCDVARFDHFRGLEKYWAVAPQETTARNGEWLPGPGDGFLRALRNALGGLPCLVEDLGVITREVRLLKEQFHLPGMEVLQFMRPQRRDAILYTGTHDNATLLGWYLAAEPYAKSLCREIGVVHGRTAPTDAVESLLQYAYAAENTWVVTPFADLAKLGETARFNRPGTVNDENWSWRIPANVLKLQLAEEIRTRTQNAKRC